MGFDDQGNPIIRSQVIFVGEYFGYFGQEYKDKTAMKEELEPVQALMTGNDVIFISSEDFASGDNPMKLINQLESKHIIFDGGSAKKTIEKWLSEGNQGRTDVSERIEKLSPEQAFLRSAMLQLQMHYGELKDFYKNYSGDESYREMLKSLFDQYQVLKAQSEELNKRIRNLQYKDSRRSDDKKLHTAEIDGMMDQWRDINNQIKSVYTQNNQLQEIINKHKDTLLNDPDYQARLNDLMTAETLLERGDTLDNVPGETMPEKIKKVCNNSLAGFSSMTRHKAEKVFQPFFNTVQAMFNRYIRVAKTIEFNKIFNKFIK
jgi:predicted nuclease with TOPRIM domain